MEKLDLMEYLRQRPYPGRGILIGQAHNGTWAQSVIAYFIMGRSENSRNRVFEPTEDGIRTRAFDESRMTDPSLIIYHPVRMVGRAWWSPTGTRRIPSGTACCGASPSTRPCAPAALSPIPPTIPPGSPASWTAPATTACLF